MSILQVYALTHIAQLLAIDETASEKVQAAQAGRGACFPALLDRHDEVPRLAWFAEFL